MENKQYVFRFIYVIFQLSGDEKIKHKNNQVINLL